MYVIVISYPWSLYLICKHSVLRCHICKSSPKSAAPFRGTGPAVLYARHKQRAPLICSHTKIISVVTYPFGLYLHAVKPNRFTTPTHITFFALGLYTNVPLMLLISWLLTLYAQNVLRIMANCTYMALQQFSAWPSWSIV